MIMFRRASWVGAYHIGSAYNAHASQDVNGDAFTKGHDYATDALDIDSRFTLSTYA